jgi:hypothetical protein
VRKGLGIQRAPKDHWLSGFSGPEENKFLRLCQNEEYRFWIRFFLAMIRIGRTMWLFLGYISDRVRDRQ